MRTLITNLMAVVSLIVIGCAPTAATSSHSWKDGVLESAADALEQGYVFEDIGGELAAMLRKSQPEFDNIDDKQAYADAVTSAMRSIANDLHLRFVYSPAKPDANGHNQMMMHGEMKVSFDWRMLDSDIAYMSFDHFMDLNDFLNEFDAAMGELASAKGIILDLRANGGGDPKPVQHIATYFFSERTQLLSAEIRGQGIFENWTKEEVSGPRMANTPLYILISDKTFSAAESFAFAMQIKGRATLVGENSGGGGHFGNTQRLSPDFTLFVPFGRAFDPSTGNTWEATGVKPDVMVSAESALDIAHELAISATRAGLLGR